MYQRECNYWYVSMYDRSYFYVKPFPFVNIFILNKAVYKSQEGWHMAIFPWLCLMDDPIMIMPYIPKRQSLFTFWWMGYGIVINRWWANIANRQSIIMSLMFRCGVPQRLFQKWQDVLSPNHAKYRSCEMWIWRFQIAPKFDGRLKSVSVISVLPFEPNFTDISSQWPNWEYFSTGLGIGLAPSVIPLPEPILAMRPYTYMHYQDSSSQISIILRNLKQVIKAPMLHLEVGYAIPYCTSLNKFRLISTKRLLSINYI